MSEKIHDSRKNLLDAFEIDKDNFYNDPTPTNLNKGVRGKTHRRKDEYDNSKERHYRALFIDDMRVRLGLSRANFCKKMGITTYKYNEAVKKQHTDFTVREWDMMMYKLGFEMSFRPTEKYFKKTISGVPKKVLERDIRSLRKEYNEKGEDR